MIVNKVDINKLIIKYKINNNNNHCCGINGVNIGFNLILFDFIILTFELTICDK